MSEYNELVRVAASRWNSEIKKSDANPGQKTYSGIMENLDLLIQCITCGASAIALIGAGYCADCAKNMKAPSPPSRVAAQKVVEKLKVTSNKTTADLIRQVCDDVKEMLVEKNRAYGDSALNPVRIFSSASPDEQLKVRIDDKLSRLARGKEAGEDVIFDLIGYLVLLKVHSEKGKL